MKLPVAMPTTCARAMPSPSSLDVGGVDVNVIHGSGDPGMPESLLEDEPQAHDR